MDPRLRDRLRVFWWLGLPFFPVAAALAWLVDDSSIRASVAITWRDFRHLARGRSSP